MYVHIPANVGQAKEAFAQQVCILLIDMTCLTKLLEAFLCCISQGCSVDAPHFSDLLACELILQPGVAVCLCVIQASSLIGCFDRSILSGRARLMACSDVEALTLEKYSLKTGSQAWREAQDVLRFE